MPYTDEFKRIRRKYFGQFKDSAVAEKFAYEDAFRFKIKTFTFRGKRGSFYALLMVFILFLVTALLMPQMTGDIASNYAHLGNATDGAFLQLIFISMPVVLIVVLLIILVMAFRA